MAQRLITVVTCDLDHAQEVDAVPFTVSIAGPGETPTTYDVDLCDTCAKSYLDLRAEVVEHGRPQSRQRRAPVAPGAVHPPRSCPASGCDYVTTTATGLTAHAKTVHGLTVAELDGTASIPCPADGCGRKFSARQGLSVHLSSTHPDHPDAPQAAAG